MKLNKIQNNPQPFKMRVLPDMRKRIFYETKNIFNKNTASQMLNELLNAGNDYSSLEGFYLEQLKNAKIYCDLYIKTTKNNQTKYTYIHTPVNKSNKRLLGFLI